MQQVLRKRCNHQTKRRHIQETVTFNMMTVLSSYEVPLPQLLIGMRLWTSM
jgi:hypothetical protein